jgi:hypothetical protein
MRGYDMPTSTHSADQAVDDLRQFISKGEYGLNAVPSLIKEIIRNEYWRERVVQSSGAVAHFDRFEQFVAEPPPDGVGADVPTLLRLCSGDVEAVELIDQVTQKGPGSHRGNQHTTGKDNNIHLSTPGPKGTDKRAALRRLRKDRPDLHAKVLAGELTPHGAMVEAGFRPRAYRMPTTISGLVDAIRRHFTPEQIAELVRLLSQEVG